MDSGIARPTAPPQGSAVDATATPTDPGKQSRVAAHIPVVAAFDGYRAYAILGIVFLHLLGFSGVLGVAGSNWFAHLIQGTLDQFVDILFIVSGFVVFLPTVARHGEFGNVSSFAIRRVARLGPAYWAVLAILIVLASLVTISPPIPLPSFANVAIFGVFMHIPAGLVKDWGPGFGADPPLWTLSLEVTFYFILPFVASWYFRRPLVGLAIAAAITVLWQEALLHWSTTEALLGHPSAGESARLRLAAGFQFPFFAFSFGAGMTGAWAYVRLRERFEPERLARHMGRVQLAALVPLALSCYLLGSHTLGEGGLAARNSPVSAIGFTASLTTLMVATALGRGRWQKPFAHPFARSLGDISYGIYLIHLPIIVYGVALLFEHSQTAAGSLPSGDGSFGTFIALSALVLPLAVGYGYVSGRFLEQPIRRWAHRFGRREQARATGTAIETDAPAG
jgi:peptidoglycan/LPS O-acetylase OafA/YrhL